MSHKHTIAIAYDFDGTLAPGNMQEHVFLPELGIPKEEFWKNLDRETEKYQGDRVLVYMRLMLKTAQEKGIAICRRELEAYGKGLRLFPGVEPWFDRITAYGHERNIDVEHYLISAGNAEIIEGTSIASKFAKIYASRFIFDENGVACWPALAINYTGKTQYLFRINKGVHDINDNKGVNRHIDEVERPVPFERIIFIGDGMTDIPCFRLVSNKGGLAIAVYNPAEPKAKTEAEDQKQYGRVHRAVPADYTTDSALERLIMARISYVSNLL